VAFLFEDPCLGQQRGRRRGFWTTQIQGCGSYFDVCGNACAVPGLEYIDSDIVPPPVNADNVHTLAVRATDPSGKPVDQP
jgi:hypothetical protein